MHFWNILNSNIQLYHGLYLVKYQNILTLTYVVIIDVKIDIIIMNEPTNLKKFGLTRTETFFFKFL